MKTVSWIPGLLLLVTVGLPAASHDGPVSDVADRTSASLVVYTNGVAVVNESREVELPRGRAELRFEGIGEMAVPASAVLRSDRGLRLLEQQYLFNTISRRGLLESYLGREIAIERLDKRTETRQRSSGTLLSLDGGMVVRLGDEVVIDPEGTVILPGIGEGMAVRPAFVWLLDGSPGGSVPLDVSYITRGLTWHCDYLLLLDNGSDSGSLEGRVTVQNTSGASFSGVSLELVAGEVNIVEQEQPRQKMMLSRAAPMAVAEDAAGSGQGFAGAETFEYYRYTLGRKVDLPERGMKQMDLLEVGSLNLERIYRYRDQRNFYYGPGGGDEGKRPVEVLLEWENSGGNYPGVPLPAGVVRVYESSGGNSLRLLGQDRIRQLPRGEKVTLRAGNAFNLLGEKKQLEFERLSDRLRRVTIEIKLTNRKDEKVTVRVEESIPGDWEITDSTHEYEKTSSGSVRFVPRVPAGGETVIRYTARIL